MAFAAPTNLDECRGAYPGEHRACEAGKHETIAGDRQENHGINQLEHGNLAGIGNVLGGIGKEVQGGLRESAHHY